VWGEGNEEKFKVAEILRYAKLPSKSVVYLDSIVTTVMFERNFLTLSGLNSRIQVLSERRVVDENLDEDNRLHMEELYQAYQKRFETISGTVWAAWYMTTTADLASKLWDGFELLRCEEKDTLQWFATNFWHLVKLISHLSNRVLRAYSLLLLKCSDVRLKLTSIGMKEEFGVLASRKFFPGEFIYELVGLVPIDGLASHTELSVTMPHIDQGETVEPRVLFGPIRFINHHCDEYNVQVSKRHLFGA